ncbi:Ribonuclease inhibitor [Seminavis robusta]|uniref:Ribonuclease inhibitor n=1 Tax=Seminavis robusta TaxID=568900 RepID=A0A9N8HYM8_9STRA|nr:Ribonuclease inhibitor [Seminavis robusta]|eukprot:Sro2566_g331430.1 Ribonuclease inhibitor (693) ;mRNA; r:1636-3714
MTSGDSILLQHQIMPIKRSGCSIKNGSREPTNGSRNASSNIIIITPPRSYTFPPSEPRFHKSEDETLEGHHVVDYLQQALSYHDGGEPQGIISLSCEETVDDVTIEKIATLLQRNHRHVRLQALYLPKNHLTSAAAAHIARITETMAETLLHLDLRQNNLGVAGLKTLIQTPQPLAIIQTLNLEGCDLPKAAASVLADLLRRNNNLQELYLGYNNRLKPQGIQKIIAGLADNPDSKLNKLDLKGTSMGGKGLKELLEYLNGNDTMHALDLSRNNMRAAVAEGFAYLLKFPNHILHLDLGSNDIGPDGINALARALKENGALQGYCRIQQLILNYNQLGDQGAICLANAIQNNSTLQHLDLSKNNIGLDGVTQLANSLAINYSIRTVNLDGNNIDDQGALALAHVLRRKNCHIEELTCHDNPLISEDHGEFYLQHAFRFRESLKTHLGELQKDIEADRLMSVDWWRRPPHVQVTDWEVDVLVQSLTRHNPQLLQTIYLTGARITDESLKHLFSRYIAENPSLQRLYLKNVTLRDDMNAIKQALCTNSTLRILNVTSCNLSTVECAANLAVALRHNRMLQRISLQCNSLGDEGFCLLWQAINGEEPHPSLASLNMSNNGLTDRSMEAICKSGSLGRLEALYVEKNQITDRGALDLAKALMDSKALKVLSVAQNQEITSRGQIALRAFAPMRFSC